MTDSSESGIQPGTPSSGVALPASALPHPYHSLDPDGVILTVNDAWLEVLGYDREDVEGRPFSAFLANATVEEFDEQYRDCLDGGSVENLEYELFRADGDTVAVSFTGTVEYENGETVERTHWQFTDSTECKRLRDGLRESKERYESLFTSLPDAILVADSDRRIVDCNPAFTDLFGYDLANIEGKMTSSVYADESEFIEMGEEIAAHDGDPQFTHRARYRTKSGEVFPGDTNVFYLRDETGGVAGFIGLIRDVSDRVERERQLTAYEQAVEGSTDLLSAADTDHTFLFANRAYREYHDLLDADVREKSLESVLGQERFETIEPHLDRALEGETVEYEMERPGPDGSRRTLDIRYYPLRDDTGDIRGVAAAMRDVTEQKEMEAELAERNRQLTVMERILRHNLQNEMNVIQGYADLIQEAGSGEVASYADTIDETTRRLLTIVDKQREITKLLASQPETDEFDLSTVVQRSIREARDRHPQATIRQFVPETLTAIATQNLGTAIKELIGNAVHYADRSAPTVTIRARAEQESAVLRIEDRGPGIPEMERKVLTGEEEIAPLYHGSGLGLWLVNVIVEQSGGSLSFETNDPRGSVVTIRLPRN